MRTPRKTAKSRRKKISRPRKAERRAVRKGRRAKAQAAPAITREITSFLIACAAEADPRTRILKARKALASLSRANLQGQIALRALLAHALIDAGDRVAARREWLRMAASGLAPVRARIEAGLLAESEGKHGAAEKDYRTAARRATDPEERVEAYAVLARFLVRRGTPERALALLRETARKFPHSLLAVAEGYVESRMTGDPAPLARFRGTLERAEKKVPLYGYFLGFLNLWDGQTLEALKTLRGFLSRGIDAATTWGRELAPELDHARRTIVQIDAVSRVRS